MSIDQLAEDFEHHLARQGRAAGTVKGYDWALRDLTEHLAEAFGVGDANEITGTMLEHWQDELRTRTTRHSNRVNPERLSPRTRQVATNAARGFLKWLARRRIVAQELEDSIVTVKAARLLPRPLADDDFARLLAYLLPRRPRMAGQDLRDRALFTYLVATGARVSEALQVSRDEVEQALVIQKGGSQKWLRIPPAVVGYVSDYLASRVDECPWLWVTYDSNRPTRRLDAAGVREIWTRLARRVGVPRFTTHQLRHTSATLLLDQGLGHIAIADHLGHADLSTVMNYARVRGGARQGIADAMQQLLSIDQAAPAPDSFRPRLLPSLNPRRRG